MTEKEQRDLEKLKTVEDYIDEIDRVKDSICYSKKADKKIDSTLELLAEALYDKYKYMIDISRPYRKKQGIFSKIADCFREKRVNKQKQIFEEDKKPQESMVEDAQPSSTSQMDADVLSLSAQSQQNVEIIDSIAVKQIEERNIEENPQDET